MPFQIAFSVKKTELPTVLLLSAGEDQTIICGGTTIFLEATVDDPGNLPGHTLLWEQLEGATVVLSTPNQLTTNYPFTETSDKIFRFWIDKCTAAEQFRDVRIWHTPTSLCAFSDDDEERSFNLTLDPESIQCNDITGTVTVTAGPPTVPEGEDLGGIVIDVLVEWEHPTDLPNQPYIVQYTVFEDGAPVLQLPSSIPPTAGDGVDLPSGTREYAGTLAEYRVDTLYNISGKEFVRESCVQDFTGLTIPLAKAYNSTGAFGTDNNERTFSRVNFGFLTESEESPTTFATDGEEKAFSRINYGFISESEESPTTFATSVNEKTINITKFDTGGIGG